MTGNITVPADNDADVAFKICAPFSACKAEINDVFIDDANHIYLAMPMYNLRIALMNSLLFNQFQPSVVFHIEKFIQFAM